MYSTNFMLTKLKGTQNLRLQCKFIVYSYLNSNIKLSIFDHVQTTTLTSEGGIQNFHKCSIFIATQCCKFSFQWNLNFIRTFYNKNPRYECFTACCVLQHPHPQHQNFQFQSMVASADHWSGKLCHGTIKCLRIYLIVQCILYYSCVAEGICMHQNLTISEVSRPRSNKSKVVGQNPTLWQHWLRITALMWK